MFGENRTQFTTVISIVHTVQFKPLLYSYNISYNYKITPETKFVCNST